MYGEERILILDLLEILKKHSDENHRLTQQEIMTLLKSAYGYETLQRKTVKNNLEKLRTYTELVEGEGISTRNIKNKHTSEPDTIEVFSNFYYNHAFNDSELRLMIDSLIFSKHTPSKKKKEIIEKLENLTSKHFNSRKNNISMDEMVGLKDHQLFENIKNLDKAISEGKKITFSYNRYTINDKYQITFTPEKNSEGKPREYVINPYHMVATNGNYYLVCNNDRYDNLSYYRIDRISNIVDMEIDRKPIKKIQGLEAGLSLPNHMKEHVYMFAGESIKASIRFKKTLITEFIDWFGESIHFSNQTKDEVTANLTINRNALRKWALQYGLYFKVIAPEDLVKDIKQDIEQVRVNYQS